MRSGTVWTQQAKLTASDAASTDMFGLSVSVSADTAIVGAYWDDDWGTDSGSTYVFTRTGTVWTQKAKLAASDAGWFDQFGWSVALSGDTAIVTTVGSGIDPGSAYVFTRSGDAWTQRAKLIASDVDFFDEFGRASSVDGESVICGARYHDVPESNSGAAYVFDMSSFLNPSSVNYNWTSYR